MNLANRLKVLLLVLGDLVVLYLTLFLTLILRYRDNFYSQFINWHFLPFSIIFAIWLVIFYIAGLYDIRRLRNNLEFIKTLLLATFINALVAILFFYLIPAFGITPKTNLLIFIAIFAVIGTIWRRFFNQWLSGGSDVPNKILLLGNSNATEEIKEIVKTNPQLGYEIKASFKENPPNLTEINLTELITANGVNLIIMPRHLKRNEKLTNALYNLLTRGVTIRDSVNFYEAIARRVPLAELEESWFLENLLEHQKFYDPLKHAWEFLAALIVGIILLPLEILIAIIVKLSSRGPAIYKQVRTGQHGREFILYKFRTMKVDAEKDGIKWAKPGDKRATAFGRFLRHTHLDELPQLWNIIKGDLSFVGPRPERPELVRTLKEKVPYYEIRLLVKPGVTGWAQINHRADATTEDVVQKLQYDIYYIKNRSPLIDLTIILKTIKTIFITPK